jgi:hypothetical protein
MKTARYKTQVYDAREANGKSCEGCYFLDGVHPLERPCNKVPLDKNFPECLAEFRRDKKNLIFVKREVNQHVNDRV